MKRYYVDLMCKASVVDCGSKQTDIGSAPAKHLYNICTMLDQRCRRWADVVQMLYKWFVFSWAYPGSCDAGSTGSVRYSDRSIFRQVYIPTARYSDMSLFRQVYIPTGRYSDMSLFRQAYIPTGWYSDMSIFRQVDIPTGRYSDSTLM